MKAIFRKCETCGTFLTLHDSEKYLNMDEYILEDDKILCPKHNAIDLLYRSFNPEFGGFCDDRSIEYIKKAINLIEKFNACVE